MWKLLFPVAAIFVAGCSGEPPAQAASSGPAKKNAVAVPQGGIVETEAKYDAAKAAFDKSPKDPVAKAAFVSASNALAFQVMNSDMPPREKYTRALALYRASAKADPKNAEARKWIKTIEDIYKSMGRPIPKT